MSDSCRCLYYCVSSWYDLRSWRCTVDSSVTDVSVSWHRYTLSVVWVTTFLLIYLIIYCRYGRPCFYRCLAADSLDQSWRWREFRHAVVFFWVRNNTTWQFCRVIDITIRLYLLLFFCCCFLNCGLCCLVSSEGTSRCFSLVPSCFSSYYDEILCR